VQVDVTRSGGLIGLPLRGTLDTATLPAERAAAVDEALRGLPYGLPPAPPQHPDSFRYEITVIDHSGRRSAVLDEAQVPDELRRILDDAITAAS